VGLNALWGLGFSAPELGLMAAQLGSDMPFCLDGGTQLCFGRGEQLEPVDPPASPALAVLLIKHPASHVSTPWAYGRCKAMRGDFYLDQEEDFEQRRNALRTGPLLQALASGVAVPTLRNDLQLVVEPEVDSVQQGLALLRQLNGASTPLAVAMSGSGPSSFALFDSLPRAQAAQQQLETQLIDGGFEAWSCGFVPKGVSLG
jgi:4-diphosphocytidyl-2-C-methyl-D-erythritol kinase